MKPIKDLFISRYSVREIKTFLKHFNAQYDGSDETEDFSVGNELESMLLTYGRGGFTRGINRDATTTPENRYEYLKVYEKYQKSDAPFENLKWTSFDEETQKMYKKKLVEQEKMYDVKLEDLEIKVRDLQNKLGKLI